MDELSDVPTHELAAIVIFVIRDLGLEKVPEGRRLLKQCFDDIRGTYCEDIILNFEFVENEVKEFRKRSKAMDECMVETMRMIRSGQIPNDELAGTRWRIKELSEEFLKTPANKRTMGQLKTLTELYEQIFLIKRDIQNRI